MNTISIRLCGATTVTDDEGRVSAVPGVKPVRILEMLALQQGTPISKDVIADRLWDGEPPKSYLGTLESYVSNLRRAMGTTGRRAALATTSQGYVLTAEARVDITEIRTALRLAAAANDADRPGLVEQALAMQQGTLLAGDAYSLWAEEARGDFDTLIVDSCIRAARSAQITGHHETARRLAEHAIGVDESAEVAWQIVLESLESMGRPGEGLGVYTRLRASMLDRLGIEPSAVSREIYARMLQGCHGGGRAADRDELSALVQLLRQRLEGWPGIVVPEQDSRLAEVAVKILAVA